MIKGFFITVFFLCFTFSVTAQQIDQNSAIVKKYRNDTTGFIAYPDVYLLENLKLPEKYTSLEINTWVSIYHLYGDKHWEHQYQNLYRYPGLHEKTKDTTVISKQDMLKCFTACLCPDLEPWYISAKTNDNKIVTVGDTIALKSFLGDLNNKFNAYLWMQSYPVLIRYQEVPVKTSSSFKYKKVTDGFLIAYRTIDDSESWTTTVDLTYLVTPDFKIKLVSKRNPVRSKYNYKI